MARPYLDVTTSTLSRCLLATPRYPGPGGHPICRALRALIEIEDGYTGGDFSVRDGMFLLANMAQIIFSKVALNPEYKFRRCLFVHGGAIQAGFYIVFYSESSTGVESGNIVLPSKLT